MKQHARNSFVLGSGRTRYEGTFNYAYAGQKPSSKVFADVLGDTVGGLEIFNVNIEGHDFGYFCGSLPASGNFNIFTEYALELDSQLGIHISENESDSSIVSKVNNLWKRILLRPESKPWFDHLGIDPFHAFISVNLSKSVCIHENSNENSRVLMEMWITDPSDLTYFKPSNSVLYNYVQSGDYAALNLPVDEHRITRIEKEINSKIQEINLMKKHADTEYPYDADDYIAQALEPLQTLIYRQRMGNAATLEDAELYVRDKSVDNTRSYMHNNPQIDQYIADVFDWAQNNNLSVEDLRTACRDILKIAKARRYLKNL